MAGLKKRKFSFDIPRLKIGPSKSDTKVLRDHLLSSQLDSPPPTPKSVRPPLSPYTEAELRSACAYVLQNFKPSHIVYEEQYGGPSSNQAKPQLDYAAIKAGAPKQTAASPPALVKVNTHDQESAIDADGDGESLSSEKFRYKPEVPTEDLFRHEEDPQERAVSRAALRADQLMAPQRSKTISGGTKSGHGRHTRSASNPIRGMALAAPKPPLPAERPRTIEHTASAGTTGSTPETDNTDYPWSEKASTAMTSAALTPARSSKRTSSQAIASESESSSMPKGEPVNADWMRQELEKHKKAHEARKHQGQELALEEAASSTVVSDTTPTQATTQATTPVKVKIPARKPVPTSRSSSRQEALPPRTDSTQSVEQVHMADKSATLHAPAAEIQRTASKRVADTSRAESRQTNHHERAPQRKRSISRVRDYFRPGPTGETSKREGESRGVSRSASVTRHVKDYFRPATSSRRPSVDIGGRTESRGRSIDSFRSTVSHVAPSVTSTTNKFKAFKTFHRGRKSDSSPEVSRPGSSSSNKEGRGRTATKEEGSPQQQKPKPSVNLNRELPPLPSLNQWRSSSHSATLPISGSRLVSPASEKPDPITSARPFTSQGSKTENRSSAQRLVPTSQAEILAARMGSPTTTRTRSSKSSVDLRVVPPPPQPIAPPPAPPTLSATMTSLDDLDYAHLAPTSSIDPTSVNAEARNDRRRSKSIQTPKSSDRPGPPQRGTSSPRITSKMPLTGKAAVVKTARSPPPTGGPPNFNLFRSPSKAIRPSATTMNTPKPVSRASSDDHRKYSVDDYTTRMQDPRYQNMVEISASQQTLATQLPTREKAKSKWWQRKDKKEQSPGWMDQVLKSGSSSGLILTDDVAGSPIVRY